MRNMRIARDVAVFWCVYASVCMSCCRVGFGDRQFSCDMAERRVEVPVGDSPCARCHDGAQASDRGGSCLMITAAEHPAKWIPARIGPYIWDPCTPAGCACCVRRSSAESAPQWEWCITTMVDTLTFQSLEQIRPSRLQVYHLALISPPICLTQSIMNPSPQPILPRADQVPLRQRLFEHPQPASDDEIRIPRPRPF